MSTATIEKNPSLDDVRELEGRATKIRDRLDQIESRLGQVGSALAQLHAEGLASAEEGDVLRDERRSLDDEAQELQAALSHLEDRLSTERETARREAATHRLVEIAKSRRGLRDILDQRADQIVEQAKELEGAIRRANDDYSLLAHLEAEAKVLSARFEIQAPQFPTVFQPMQRNEVRGALQRIDDLPGPHLPRRFSISHRASADSAERRADVLRAIDQYARSGGLTDTPGMAILEKAGSL